MSDIGRQDRELPRVSPSQSIGLSADQARQIAVEYSYGVIEPYNMGQWKWSCRKVELTSFLLNDTQWPLYKVDITMVLKGGLFSKEIRWSFLYQIDAVNGKIVGYEDLGRQG